MEAVYSSETMEALYQIVNLRFTDYNTLVYDQRTVILIPPTIIFFLDFPNVFAICIHTFKYNQ
jgi:hypothetical protein